MAETTSTSGWARAWTLFRILMGIVGLGVLVQLVDGQEVRQAIINAAPGYLLVAWALLLASTVVKTVRWQVLLNQNGVGFTLRRLLGTYLIGTFYSQFLPGSSAGGDAMRMAESYADTRRPVDSVASVLIERAIGLVSVVTTASLLLMFVVREHIPEPVSLVIHALALLGIGALVVLRYGWFIQPLRRWMERLRLGKLADKVEQLNRALQGDLGNWRVLAVMVLLSLLANFFSMTAYYLVLLAVTEAVSYLAFISLVALIVTLEIIPLTPGSLGIREGGLCVLPGDAERG
ncbi:MAG: flippase-like domain-containing protein [Anaerolineae bacterium]|nr:flippase-like domain-containing protein [Anaerolineae bacterium]